MRIPVCMLGYAAVYALQEHVAWLDWLRLLRLQHVFVRPSPMCRGGNNQAKSAYSTRYPQSQFLSAHPCREDMEGRCDSDIVSPLDSQHSPAIFSTSLSFAVELSHGSRCHGRACPFNPEDDARAAQFPILKMADRVHRFCCSLQCELTFPQEWSPHYLLDVLTHPL